jgi:hypothetical protein
MVSPLKSLKKLPSEEELEQILKIDPDTFRLRARENSHLEFKQSFNFASGRRYARTMAAFANAGGGLIIFGVTNSPRTLIGLQNDAFERFDSKTLTDFLNEYFAPEIKWDHQAYELYGKPLGVIITYESPNKPVICLKSHSDVLDESAIYYRYSGQTKRIKYPELNQILEQKIEEERKNWQNLFEKVARVGVSNVGVLDTITGELSGHGGSFFISEDLLQKIQFIKEGQFTETDGAPTLKLIGNLVPVSNEVIQPQKLVKVKVEKHVAIGEPEILLTFLTGKEVSSPLEYIKQICYCPSSYLPIFYYIKLANMNIDKVVYYISNVPSLYEHKKTQLVQRLEKEQEDFTKGCGSLTTNTPAASAKLQFLQQIRLKQLPQTIPDDMINYFFQSITFLQQGQFEKDYLFQYLVEIVENKYADLSSLTRGYVRRAIAHLDRLFYGES